MLTALPRRTNRMVAAATISLALVLSAAACGSSKKAADPVEETTSTTEAGPISGQLIATAKNAALTVYSSLPTNVTTTTADPAGTTTTTAPADPPANSLPAIPRNGLNSAGVKKVDEGYEFTNPTYYKNPLVLDVLEDQGEWLKVLLLARPNHSVGWVKRSDVTLTSTEFRMELDLSTFTLRVYQGDELFEETTVAIGKDSTKTPTGHFYVTEEIKNSTDTGIYGAYILPINGYSEMLDTFDGGLPQIAFHGTNQPELLGTKASNGCVRMSNEAVTKLVEAMPAGTPVDIYATTPVWWTASPA